MQEPQPLEIRNVKFDLDGVPRYWHGGQRSVTLFLNGLSLFFPEGERFFIESVRAHSDALTDERLRSEAQAFYKQEGFHSREHIRYNNMLRAQGYPVDALEKRVRFILKAVRRLLPRRWHLAVTCALEHFTAIMAHVTLKDSRLFNGVHPTMAALWQWHAAEENEHKAVAFDVYQAAGGHYLERIFIMACTTLIFWVLVLTHQVRLMQSDGIASSGREWLALFRYMFIEPGWVLPVTREYWEYYRPGFHPWDLDNRELLDRWRREYATSPVYRRA